MPGELLPPCEVAFADIFRSRQFLAHNRKIDFGRVRSNQNPFCLSLRVKLLSRFAASMVPFSNAWASSVWSPITRKRISSFCTSNPRCSSQSMVPIHCVPPKLLTPKRFLARSLESNTRPGNHVVHPPAIESCNDLQFHAADSGVQSGGSSGVADLHITGSQAVISTGPRLMKMSSRSTPYFAKKPWSLVIQMKDVRATMEA